MSTSTHTVKFHSDTSVLIATLDAISRHAGALAKELGKIQAEAESEQAKAQPEDHASHEE